MGWLICRIHTGKTNHSSVHHGRDWWSASSRSLQNEQQCQMQTTENVSWKSSCLIAALTLSFSHSFVDSGRRRVSWLCSAAALWWLVLWLRCKVLCDRIFLHFLFCHYFFRTASIMFLSHDLQMLFSVESWGIISAFGQVFIVVYIAFLQNKSSTLPNSNCWTFLVFLYLCREIHTHMHTNKGVDKVEAHLLPCGICTFEKGNAAHLIIKNNEHIKVIEISRSSLREMGNNEECRKKICASNNTFDCKQVSRVQKNLLGPRAFLFSYN